MVVFFGLVSDLYIVIRSSETIEKVNIMTL